MSSVPGSAITIADGEITIDAELLASMVISKTRGGLPTPGFFDCAARLGRFVGDATGLGAWAFHAVEINAAFDFWALPSTFGESE